MKKHQVATQAVDSYDQDKVDHGIKTIIDLLGGIEKFVKPGQTVFIKPNLLMPIEPAKCATTHPTVVAAVAKLCKDIGAHVIIGDSPGGPYNKTYLNLVYKKTGMARVAEELGVELNKDFTDVTYDYPEGAVAKHIPILGAIDNADVVINIAKLKTHSFAGFSAACKNMYGAIPGLVKVEWHNFFQDMTSFANCCHDICAVIGDKIVLHVIDAVIGMEGPGPAAGTPVQMGLVMASADYTAIDIAAVRLMGSDPNTLPTLSTAIDRGLCNENFDIDIIGADIVEFINPKYKTVPAVILFRPSKSRLLNWMFKRIITQKPVVSKRKCRGCDKCVHHCPASAVIIKQRKESHYVTFDLQKCIRCYCCQELCPFHLVKVRRSLLTKMIQRSSIRRGKRNKRKIRKTNMG